MLRSPRTCLAAGRTAGAGLGGERGMACGGIAPKLARCAAYCGRDLTGGKWKAGWRDAGLRSETDIGTPMAGVKKTFEIIDYLIYCFLIYQALIQDLYFH
jgi:hypothetical protein